MLELQEFSLTDSYSTASKGNSMIGYSLTISELKAPLSRNLLAELRETSAKKLAERIREKLQGEFLVRYDPVVPWWSVGKLTEKIEERLIEGIMLHGGAYPYLFTAKGRDIIEEICEVDGSRHGELGDMLEPARFYLCEAWDLS